MHVGICNMHVETQHLFLMTRKSQLRLPWRVIPSSLPEQQVQRVHHMQADPYYWLRQRITEHFVLKVAVTVFYKCADWVDFIQKNHRLQKTRKTQNTQSKWSKVNHGSPLGQPWVPDFWRASVGPLRKLGNGGSRYDRS